jgi:uncharacterized protein YsxB (DUF464 family)
LITIIISAAARKTSKIEVTGHGGRRKGRDIVCAAVSAITQTALSGLLHYGKDSVKYRLDDGGLTIEISEVSDPGTQETFDVILTTMILGLRGIERENPDRVKVKAGTRIPPVQ